MLQHFPFVPCVCTVSMTTSPAAGVPHAGDKGGSEVMSLLTNVSSAAAVAQGTSVSLKGGAEPGRDLGVQPRRKILSSQKGILRHKRFIRLSFVKG